MRSLQRDWRDLYYAVKIDEESVLDDYGNDTLEKKIVYGEAVPLRASVGINAGQDVVNIFGNITGYSRTISYVGESCPFNEGDIVWFGVEPTEKHNYVVIKVADSKNGYLIALREVSDRG
jgi:hypothetical protein